MIPRAFSTFKTTLRINFFIKEFFSRFLTGIFVWLEAAAGSYAAPGLRGLLFQKFRYVNERKIFLPKIDIISVQEVGGDGSPAGEQSVVASTRLEFSYLI